MWDVIAQKVRGGALLEGSELVLEVAEARLLDVTVDGSLLVHAHGIMGHVEAAQQAAQQQGASSGSGERSGGGSLRYSCANGRVHLMNVAVHNVGIDWHHPSNVYWQHRVSRHEACRIVLHGRSEFEAYDCKLVGDQVRARVRASVALLLRRALVWRGWCCFAARASRACAWCLQPCGASGARQSQCTQPLPIWLNVHRSTHTHTHSRARACACAHARTQCAGV
jgi:hypothetical protein